MRNWLLVVVLVLAGTAGRFVWAQDATDDLLLDEDPDVALEIDDEALIREALGDTDAPRAGTPTEDWAVDATDGDLNLLQEDFGEPIATTVASPVSAPKTGDGINVSAFQELLKENVDLRRDLEAMFQERDTIAAEKQSLRREIKELEEQVTQLMALSKKTPPVAAESSNGPDQASLDKIASLEADVAALQALKEENAELKGEVDLLKQSIEQQQESPVSVADSDMYRALEQEHADLKRQHQEALAKLQESEEAATELSAAEGREAELQALLDESKKSEARLEETIEKLLVRVPDMEKELAELRDTIEMKNRDLSLRESEFTRLSSELEKREHRLIKAERVAALMEQTREEVRIANQKEKRDLHYNMAAVYSKEGKYAEAEREYLKALRVDPTDADSHYNLAILYDDVLGNMKKAAMHYRAYLKLSPNADDVDEVKSWLVRIEVE